MNAASFPPPDLHAAKNQPTDAFTYGKYECVSTSDASRWDHMVYTVAGVKRGWHGAGWEG